MGGYKKKNNWTGIKLILKFEHSKGQPVHAFALQENNRHIKGRRQT